MKKIRPYGVFAVCVLTVLSGLAFLAFGYLAFVLNGISSNPPKPTIIDLGLAFSIGEAFLSFVDAVLILRGMRAGYFSSIILWSLILTSVIWWISLIGFEPFLSVPLGYCAICMTYFSTPTVREYFGM